MVVVLSNLGMDHRLPGHLDNQPLLTTMLALLNGSIHLLSRDMAGTPDRELIHEACVETLTNITGVAEISCADELRNDRTH